MWYRRPKEGYFELIRVSESAPVERGKRHLRVDEGVSGESYRTGETILLDDPYDHEKSKPVDDSFQSLLSAPVGKWGVIQGVSDESGVFDEQDRQLAELLAAHGSAALERIERERNE